MDITRLATCLGRAAKEIRVDRDTVLFSRGDRPVNMYGLIEGQACLLRHSMDGVPLTLHRVRPGGFFAEASLFASAYHCDCEVSAGSVVIGFSRAAVLRLMEEDAKFARDFCQILAHQIQGLRANVELRGIRSAEDRILAALSLRLGDDEDRVDIVGTWKDFAHDLGLTHEALYRALRRLEDDGRIRREKMGVWVTATGGI